MFIGIVLALIGASFSGWAQELIGQEKAGLWYAYTENEDDLFLDPSGNFPNYGDGAEIRLEGTITGIEYFGSLEDYAANEDFYSPYPIRSDMPEESSIAPGDKFSKINSNFSFGAKNIINAAIMTCKTLVRFPLPIFGIC